MYTLVCFKSCILYGQVLIHLLKPILAVEFVIYKFIIFLNWMLSISTVREMFKKLAGIEMALELLHKHFYLRVIGCCLHTAVINYHICSKIKLFGPEDKRWSFCALASFSDTFIAKYVEQLIWKTPDGFLNSKECEL